MPGHQYHIDCRVYKHDRHEANVLHELVDWHKIRRSSVKVNQDMQLALCCVQKQWDRLGRKGNVLFMNEVRMNAAWTKYKYLKATATQSFAFMIWYKHWNTEGLRVTSYCSRRWEAEDDNNNTNHSFVYSTTFLSSVLN